MKEIDDVMVKDPFCNVYFARKEGIHLKFNGEDLYFCSTECRDKYIAMKTESTSK
jgi:YHS domain-containing protein